MGSNGIQSEDAGRLKRNLWTDEDNSVACSLRRRGADVATIAEAVPHPFGAVQTQLNRLGLRHLPRSSPARERIVELARDGWTVSRIARQCGAQEAIVERVVLSARLAPKVTYLYPRGRYGADLPMPVPGALKLELSVPVYVPAPKSDKSLAPRLHWTPEEAAAFDTAVLAGASMQAVAKASGRTMCACYHRPYRRGLLNRSSHDAGRLPALLESAEAAAAARPAPTEHTSAKRSVWTAEKLGLTRTMHDEGATTEAKAKRLGDSATATMTQRKALGLLPIFGCVPRNACGWSDDDVSRLAELAASGLTTSAIAKTLGRTELAVAHVKWRHGIRSKRTPTTLRLLPSEREARARPASRRTSHVPDRVLDALRREIGQFVTTSDLVDALYASDADGGPLTAFLIVRGAVKKIRERGCIVEFGYCRGFRHVEATAA